MSIVYSLTQGVYCGLICVLRGVIITYISPNASAYIVEVVFKNVKVWTVSLVISRRYWVILGQPKLVLNIMSGSHRQLRLYFKQPAYNISKHITQHNNSYMFTCKHKQM